MTKSLNRAGLILAAVTLFGCDEPGGRSGKFPVDVADAVSFDATADVDSTTVTSRPDVTGTTTSTPDTQVVTDIGQDTADTTVRPDTSGPAPILDPACIDGKYTETLPNDRANIDGLVAGYSASQYQAFVDDVLAARYPVGRFLVQTGLDLGADDFGNCVELYTHSRNSADDILGSLSTVVHECGHLADIYSGAFILSDYLITENLSFKCAELDTFARNLLNEDDYSALLPNDFYKSVYLEGQGSEQGYDMVLEEATQYVNSLATDWAIRDQMSPGVSITARDGILTFLWYIERYLQLARLEHPDTYADITSSKCWREATLTVWGRGWLYLNLSKDERQLGIDDDKIERLVLAPELLDEVARLRSAAGCR